MKAGGVVRAIVTNTASEFHHQHRTPRRRNHRVESFTTTDQDTALTEIGTLGEAMPDLPMPAPQSLTLAPSPGLV